MDSHNKKAETLSKKTSPEKNKRLYKNRHNWGRSGTWNKPGGGSKLHQKRPHWWDRQTGNTKTKKRLK